MSESEVFKVPQTHLKVKPSPGFEIALQVPYPSQARWRVSEKTAQILNSKISYLRNDDDWSYFSYSGLVVSAGDVTLSLVLGDVIIAQIFVHFSRPIE